MHHLTTSDPARHCSSRLLSLLGQGRAMGNPQLGSLTDRKSASRLRTYNKMSQWRAWLDPEILLSQRGPANNL